MTRCETVLWKRKETFLFRNTITKHVISREGSSRRQVVFKGRMSPCHQARVEVAVRRRPLKAFRTTNHTEICLLVHRLRTCVIPFDILVQ